MPETIDSGNVPESIKMRRRLAQLMIERGTDFSPVGHWTQGAARAMTSWGGHLQANRLETRERADNQAFGDLLARTLAPEAAAPPAATTAPATSPAPAPRAAPRTRTALAAPPPSASPLVATLAGGGELNPDIASGPQKATTNPGDPFAFARTDPRYRDMRQPGRPGAGALDPSTINDVVLHDFANNSGRNSSRSPYHLAARPDGTFTESYGPRDRAPHAYNFNGRGYGLSYDGPYGSQPTPEAMATLQWLAQGLRRENPSMRFGSHGQYYDQTRGTPLQASRSGRDLREASWRSNLFPPGQAPAAAPTTQQQLEAEIAEQDRLGVGRPVAGQAPAAAPTTQQQLEAEIAEQDRLGVGRPVAERSMVAGHPNAPNVSRETFPGGEPPLAGDAAAAFNNNGLDRSARIAAAAGGLNEIANAPIELPQVAQEPQAGPGQALDTGQQTSNVPVPPGFDVNSTAGPPAALPAADRQPAGPRAQPDGAGSNAQILALLKSGNPRAVALGVQLWRENQIAARQPQYDFQVVGDRILRSNKRTGQVEEVPGIGGRGGKWSLHSHEGNTYATNDQSGETRQISGTGQPRPPEQIRTQGIKSDQAYQNISQSLQQYLDLIKKSGVSVLPGRDKDSLTQLRRYIQLELKELMNLGVLAGPDMEIMEGMLFDPSVGIGWTGPRGLGNITNVQQRAETSIGQLQDMLRRKRNTAVAPLGMPEIPGATPQQRPGNQQGRRPLPPLGTEKELGGRRYRRDDSSPTGWVELN